MLTEDDLLWYVLRPRPGAPLDLGPASEVLDHAAGAGQYAVGAHLVWDEGFGDGWTPTSLSDAGPLLGETIADEVAALRGRVDAWVVANEVTDPDDRDRHGLRTQTPWYAALGPGHVADAFGAARAHDPDALLVLNEFGFETDDPATGQSAAARRAAYLDALDHLVDVGAPVGAAGVQAHLVADGFAERFDADGYAAFLDELAGRGVRVLVTELDVLDDGLPADEAVRDRGVADVYERFLDVALDHPAVGAVLTFGLSDRYTWLEEDRPRADGAPRRPLLYDESLRPKPARAAVARALAGAREREPLPTRA